MELRETCIHTAFLAMPQSLWCPIRSDKKGGGLATSVRIPPAHLPMLRIRIIKPTARVPLRALVAMRRNPTGVFDHPRQVQQVPGHEGRVAIGEVVLRAA